MALVTGCVGRIADPGATDGTGGAGQPAGRGGTGGAGGTGGSANDPPTAVADVGTVAIHRLNNAEYDNTIRDLMGVTASAATAFIPDEKALGFDTIADAFTMGEARYEQYFDAADTLVEQAFASATLRAKVLTCAPTSASSEAACTRQILQTFGRRAWRRPLTDAEVTALVQIGTDARALGEDWTGAMKQVVKTLLVSPPFLYRVEIDPVPDATTAHPLTGYELATRLSYLFWSTMPDDRLFALADSGQLLEPDTLLGEVERLLGDGRAAAFVSSFAGQWLGLRDLASHQVEPTAVSDWGEPLRQSMIKEGLLYFSEFLDRDRPLSEFLTADLNFADARLGKLYGFTGAAATATASAADGAPVRVVDTSDERQGFLGLASFLTVSSYSYRTAPTLRGKWVLENLLCQTIAPPPGGIPLLDDGNAGSAATQAVNVRERLAEHRANPTCAGCHVVLDPIGLGLESFDAIGRFRAQYANGDAVDASGVLPDGSSFNGLSQLSALLASDTRFLDCASRKLMTYALSRALGTPDDPELKQIRDRWRQQGSGLRALIKLLVQSPTFRYRHG